jgi:Na+:H+ antiporter, NhaB family
LKTRLLGPPFENFLGQAPAWYKFAVIAFLLLNPLVLLVAGPFVAGWLLLAQFIFTLAMALQCYPLQPGGLIAIEAVAMGLATTNGVYSEVAANFPVLLLLMFMVAGVYFLRELLLFIFTVILVRVRSKVALSLTFCAAAAVLSAFLDALTVVAVVLSVASGFYLIYHRVASGRGDQVDHDVGSDADIGANLAELESFRSFLRGLLMHAAVGTALGGVCTLVGEPQNLLVGKTAGWDFIEFFQQVAPVSVPVLFAGLLTCFLLERFRWFGYGVELPVGVRAVIERYASDQARSRTSGMIARLWVQGIGAAGLVLGLALHVAEVGLIGLALIVLVTALNGIVEERRIGHAFEEALPFTALLVTFFAIVAVIHQQHLFKPVIDFVLAQDGRAQLVWMFAANGVLSAISDNVFVATVYMSEIKQALDAGVLARVQFDLLAVSVNTGTNIPSVATPNGQAAFLFILTSSLAPLVRLGYGRMLWMALPYAIVMTAVGMAATVVWL